MVEIKTRKDLAKWVSNCPPMTKCRNAILSEDKTLWSGLQEVIYIERQLVQEICRASDRPVWGADWEEWLTQNIDKLLQEAVDIVV